MKKTKTGIIAHICTQIYNGTTLPSEIVKVVTNKVSSMKSLSNEEIDRVTEECKTYFNEISQENNQPLQEGIS